MARAMHSRCCWPPERAVPLSWSRSLTSSQRPARFRRLLHDLVELGLRRREAVDARAVGDVLVDRLGERVGLLEHHPDAGAQLHDVHGRSVDVLAVELDVAAHARRRDSVVHPVEAAQEGRLAAARRADERGHAIVVDVDRDVLQRLLLAVEDADVASRASSASYSARSRLLPSIHAERHGHAVRLAVERRFRRRRTRAVCSGRHGSRLGRHRGRRGEGSFFFHEHGPTSVARSGCEDRWRSRSSAS